MPAARTNASVWVILGLAATVLFSVFGFVWSILEGQVSELRTSLEKAKEDARWSYATKDYVNGKVDGIKDEEKTYREGLERILPKTKP
jgi:hypothetical protein